jgi:predicted nucleic acid-binding protein
VVDEAEARSVAKMHGIKTRTGTLLLFFKLLIKPREAVRMLDELVESGLYIDSQTLTRARQKVESFETER